ncbi:hypothetical protein V2G26_015614 [Clonostachys chloroleuca]|uniref:Uncharacterized protein n=1 Tax=Clonostachys chloroleuca TaxID=1926264 RepID=A0AA35MHM6_9HYPO|nr:unnamed protein product [Clonostachys chloroleuca]
MFESFRFFVPRDGHDNGSAKDGGSKSYLFRPQLSYGLKCEEKHENWKLGPNSPWITPIRGSIYPVTQLHWPPSQPRNGENHYCTWPKADTMLYIPLAMFWVDTILTGGCIWPVWWNIGILKETRGGFA